MERPALDHAFRFSAADLRENQRGSLTEAQIALIRQESLRTAGAVVVALLVIVVLALYSTQTTPNDLMPVLACVVLPVFVGIGFYVFRIEAALRPRSVKQWTGEINIQPLARYLAPGSEVRQEAEFGRVPFVLNRTQRQALRPGSYTVYYIPGLQRIVSIQAYQQDETERPAPLRPTVERFDDEGRDLPRA